MADSTELTQAKEELSILINQAESLSPNDYTEESWSSVASALSTAKVVRDNPEAELSEVNQTIATLAAALDNLITLVSVAKTELKSVIDSTQLLIASDYTSSSWSNFITALNSANECYEDESSSLALVKSAKLSLETSINELELADSSEIRTSLLALMDQCDLLAQSDYTSATWNPFSKALAKAHELYDSSSSTISQMTKAHDTLLSCKNSLIKSDTTSAREQLWALITQAELLVETDYTKTSWAIFKAQEELAIQTYNNPDATLSQIQSMISMMKGNSGFAGLTEAADLSELRRLILKAQGLSKQNYSSTDWYNLQALLDEAIELYDSIDPTQDQVNEMSARLKDFLATLTPEDNPIDITDKNVRFRYGNLSDYQDESLLPEPRNDTLYFTHQGQLFKGKVKISDVAEVGVNDPLPPTTLKDSNGNITSNDGSSEMFNASDILTDHKLYIKLNNNGKFYAYYTYGGSYKQLDVLSMSADKLYGLLPVTKGGTGDNLAKSITSANTNYNPILKYDITNQKLIKAEKGYDYITNVQRSTDMSESSAVDISFRTTYEGVDAGLITASVSHRSDNGYNHIPKDGELGQVLCNNGAGSAEWHTLDYSDINNTPEIPVTSLKSYGTGCSLILDGTGPDLVLRKLATVDGSGLQVSNLTDPEITGITDDDGNDLAIDYVLLDIDTDIIPNKSIIQSVTNCGVVVLLASTKNVPLSSDTIGLKLDGVSVANNSIVLIKDQSDPSENGIYDCINYPESDQYILTGESTSDKVVISWSINTETSKWHPTISLYNNGGSELFKTETPSDGYNIEDISALLEFSTYTDGVYSAKLSSNGDPIYSFNILSWIGSEYSTETFIETKPHNGSYQLTRSSVLDFSTDYAINKLLLVKVELGETQYNTTWGLLTNTKLTEGSDIQFSHIGGTIHGPDTSNSGIVLEEGESEYRGYLGDWLFQGNLSGSLMESIAGKRLYGKFSPYTTYDDTKLVFYYGNSLPSLGDDYNPDTIDDLSAPKRLNLNGVFYATKLYSQGSLVSVEGHTHYMSDYYANNKGNGSSIYDPESESGILSDELLANAGGPIKITDTLNDAIGRLDFRINSNSDKINGLINVVDQLPTTWDDSYDGQIFLVLDGGFSVESDNDALTITKTETGVRLGFEWQ